MNNKPQPNNNNRDLLRYAGLGSQMLAGLAIAVFVGLKADKWLKTSPLFACVLPLLTLIVIFYKLVKDTAKPPKDDHK